MGASQSGLPDGIPAIPPRRFSEGARADGVPQSEARFRVVPDIAPVMIWTSGLDKGATYLSREWLEFTGRSVEDEIGNGWTVSVHPRDVHDCVQTYEQAFDNREPFAMEYRLRRHDGVYRWVLDKGVPMFEPDGSFDGYIGLCVDVTGCKTALDISSDTGRKLIKAQEEERRTIARELHDDIVQRVVLAEIELDQLADQLPQTGESLRKRLIDVRQQLGNISTDLQAMSHRLHSSKLEYLGLTKAMQGFCEELSQHHGVVIRFHQDRVPELLPEEISLCLFRVLQGALSNSIKHSGVRIFAVWLYGTRYGIHLSILDRGIGFDVAKALHGQGIGLVSMHERVHLVGGRVVIGSGPERTGTRIDVDVPLPTGKSHRRAQVCREA